MKIEDFIDLIPIAYNSVLKLKKNKLNIDELFKLFNSNEITTREKRMYLFNLNTLTRRNKDTIWNAYIGDNLNEYGGIPDIKYEDFMEDLK